MRQSGSQSEQPATGRGVWFTPDLNFGVHRFNYSHTEYEGLAHTHPEYCIVMCLSGIVKVIHGDRLDTLSSGEVLVVSPGERHRCSFGLENQNSRGATFIMRPTVLRALLESMALPFYAGARAFDFAGKFHSEEAFHILRKLIQEFDEQRRGYVAMVESLSRQILISLFRDWPVESMLPLERTIGPQLPWLHMHRATEYMNARGKGLFRLSDLCANVGVSPSRFIPLFRNSSGISPHTYYNALLVFKARRLLQAEGASTKEAAYALGFRNVSHFCSLFHQLTGTTPQSDIVFSDDSLTPFPGVWQPNEELPQMPG